MTVSFQNRLAALKRRAGLTDTEMAIWLGAPKSTLQSWLRRGVTPHWYRRKDVDRRMKALELAVRSGVLPPATSIRQGERLSYVRSHTPA